MGNPYPHEKIAKQLTYTGDEANECLWLLTRPPLDKILKSSIVTGKLHLLPKEIPLLKEDEGAKVINTIKVPRDIKQLKGKLPPAQYKSDSQLPAVKAPGEISGADGARKISFAWQG